MQRIYGIKTMQAEMRMKRRISKAQYVIIDILILTAILCVLEWASSKALSAFPRELYTISVVLPITLIAMMRHGALGVLIAAVGGLIYCRVNGAQWDVYLIYILGNSLIALNLLWFKKPGKERLRQSTGLIVLYAASGYVWMDLGRSVFAFILGARPFLPMMVRYFATDTLSAVLSVIIVLIARRQDGVFEDQMRYLRRLAAEGEQGNEA